VRNKEPQFYTRDRRENAKLEKGTLVITGLLENFSEGKKSAKYTSASLVSKDKFALKYGRVEIRAKLPKGTGNWPALWMMGTDGGWPRCGEIDIMEHLGREEGTVYATLHTPKPDGTGHNSQGSWLKKQPVTTDFHLYGLDWTPVKVTITCDGTKVFEHTKDGPNPKELKWVFDKPYYLLMNLAYGGDWAGTKGIDEKAFPARFEIDYVRVFQKD
jgi:beta-glucanase (GH16 family)